MRIGLLLVGLSLVFFLLCTNSFASTSTDDQYFYFGGNAGLAKRLTPDKKSNFFSTQTLEQTSEADLTFPAFKSLNAKIGYSFYPNMGLELFGTYYPKFEMKISLPKVIIADHDGKKTEISADSFAVSSRANILTINLVYQLGEYKAKTKPYFSMGLGINRLTINELKIKAKSKIDINGENIFQIAKTTGNYAVSQLKIGILHKITNNLSLDVALRGYFTKKIKFDAKIYDFTSEKLVELDNEDTLSKSSFLPIGEITVGMTYQLPC